MKLDVRGRGPLLMGLPGCQPEADFLKVQPYLARAVAASGGRYELIDVIEEINRGQMQLWAPVIDGELCGALLTQVVRFPGRRVLRMIGAAGRQWRRWPEVLPILEHLARTQGCQALEAFAPRKFRHALPGFRETHVLFEKDLGA